MWLLAIFRFERSIHTSSPWHTIRATVYSQQLERMHGKLQTAYKSQWCYSVTGQHGDTFYKVTRDAIIQLSLEKLIDLLYFPDIAPLDYHFFHLLHSHLRGWQLRDLGKVISLVHVLLSSTTVGSTIVCMPDRWRQVIADDCDSLEFSRYFMLW